MSLAVLCWFLNFEPLSCHFGLDASFLHWTHILSLFYFKCLCHSCALFYIFMIVLEFYFCILIYAMHFHDLGEIILYFFQSSPKPGISWCPFLSKRRHLAHFLPKILQPVALSFQIPTFNSAIGQYVSKWWFHFFFYYLLRARPIFVCLTFLTVIFSYVVHLILAILNSTLSWLFQKFYFKEYK